MDYPIAMTSIREDVEFYHEVIAMELEASAYLSRFKWCDKIKEKYLYYNLGTTLCVFLFDIKNNQSSDIGDNLLWVIVGDLPSMYLDTYHIKTLKEALDLYAYLGGDWADKIIAKKSLKKCFPFDEKPSIELAQLLKTRVKFIKENLLENINDISIVQS
jgi:hypothetical protein